MEFFKRLKSFAKAKPRVLLLVDKPNWAFDNYAKQISKLLSAEFDFDIQYAIEKPWLDKDQYDLIWVYFWGEDYYAQFDFDSNQIIKFVSSHRWEDPEDSNYPTLTPQEFARKYLRDASSVAGVSVRLYESLKDSHPHVYLTRNGYDKEAFKDLGKRDGKMVLGWVGNSKDPVKGYHDILRPLADKHGYDLRVATNIKHDEINDFYNSIDVLLVASRNEGEPLTLSEGMAAGCFPVCTNVGITTELIKNYDNGIIVEERTEEAFLNALKWCEQNLETVRKKGQENAEKIKNERGWDVFIKNFRDCFNETLDRKSKPIFRNDDVSVDTDLNSFRRFCETFWKHGYTQIHGVTLYGNTNTPYQYEGNAAEYDGYDSVANLSNKKIIELSQGKNFAERQDIIDFLNNSADEVALHGLYHTDYSTMSAKQQREHISKGLEMLDKLFPNKVVRYFIAPFNRTNDSLYKVCREFKLQVLSATGVHLEAELTNLKIKPNTSYRYHHHRFYPESKFDYYELSIESLDKALSN